MSASATATEQEAIAATVQLYIDGVSAGDTAKLKQAFHEQAWMFGALGDQRVDMPINQMIEMAAAQPMNAAGTYEATITSVEQVDDAAVARLEESGCWGGVSFVDFFLLSRINGSWVIVGKNFAHTGGEMPAP
ncbi:MAG: nuclear transport factor 2 family protein [Actinobacteria bacterium]|nr:MAG: nuclear transport factor 2 family protein [Actinomycetota bacterium]